MELKGIHHVSALTAKADENYHFYTNVLGLRLVKKSVSQEDSSVYHLFYGDRKGSPGTELTFIEYPLAPQNDEGTNSISAISLRVPNDQALVYWKQRFEKLKIAHEEIKNRAGRSTLAFKDFEGQRLILVSDEKNEGVQGGIPWEKSSIPKEYGIIGLGPVKLTVRDAELTAGLLTDVMGFRKKGQYSSESGSQPDILVFETGDGGTGAEIHLEKRTDLPLERPGRGSVHHVAFRVETEDELHEWTNRINVAKIENTGIIDRFYFHSLYFREPNGILFEISNDGPGFEVDEHINHLGETLSLPPFLEPKREQIEAKLKPLNTKAE
ncbi:ring-cleaving dioxygenase [Bacillus aquiflavi]|uniref:Ring-cleaving dioxygenase n=1 Tax=Bacillus aquiflavi TaxID=2672567 RepID=A0A6B3VTL9_9BACI|nr:ring-cleaving dioxygenase [Bacillus aquiflavi]MBA4536175.1 ring-cleaving dioxygenase [Bacillus aquiflavi]NEY80548.1 ring-cleaving dioxygenase [Bacillus aquiflavi]